MDLNLWITVWGNGYWNIALPFTTISGQGESFGEAVDVLMSRLREAIEDPLFNEERGTIIRSALPLCEKYLEPSED
jgi:hypothetical protein